MTNGQYISVVACGAAIGVLPALGIYFDKREPYKHFIVAAATLRGITTGLLITTLVARATSYGVSAAWGAAFGLLTALTVYLAKGGWKGKDAPFLLPVAVVEGIVTGLVVRWLFQ